LVTAAAVLSLALGGVATAETQGTTVVVTGAGTLRAGGAAVTFPVEVTCGPFEAPGEQAVEVYVTQAVGDGAAGGLGGMDTFACNGTTQAVEITVMAEAYGRHFQEGVAMVWARAFACGPLGGIDVCDFIDQWTEVSIVQAEQGP
jgi:hypothetical protein